MEIKQRPFEFRFWDTKNKELFYAKTGFFDIGCTQFSIFQDNRFITQQFTGLKDKTGNKIFEGDIVLHNLNKSPFTVEWCKIYHGWKLIQYGMIFNIYPDSVKIVGNIFENPKLIK